MINNPPQLSTPRKIISTSEYSTSRPITIDKLINSSLGASKLELCSVLLSGVYKPVKLDKRISLGRKIYNIRRAITYHSKKDHRDDILKIYYTRLLAQFSDGTQATSLATDMLRDEERFHSTTMFSTLLLDVVELQAHLNLVNCINEFQSTNRPSNLQLRTQSTPQSLSQIIELLPFPRDLLSEDILRMEGLKFRVYTNVLMTVHHLYCIERGLTIQEFDTDSITYKQLPKGHILTYEYGSLPYEIRNKRTVSDVSEYVIKFDSHRLSETYNKLRPWTDTIPESILKHLNCVEKLKVSIAGIRIDLQGCKNNICICKTAIFRRMQLVGGCNDSDYQKLTTTYKFCAYAICLEEINNLNSPAITLAMSEKVIPWHKLNRGSIII